MGRQDLAQRQYITRIEIYKKINKNYRHKQTHIHTVNYIHTHLTEVLKPVGKISKIL